MNPRRLHILGELRSTLQSGQIDAIELSCQDCGYEMVEASDPHSATREARAHKETMILCTPATLRELIEAHRFLPNPQTILCATERENPDLASFNEEFSGLRYVIGAPTPSVIRATLGSILEFRIARQTRGIMARLIEIDRLRSESCVLTNSSQRSEIQDFVTDFFTRQLADFKEQMVSGISSYPKNIGDIVDELLMNAIWDANEKRVHLDRTQPTQLDRNERITVECACDGQNLILCVSDSHGTFPAHAFLKPLRYALGLRDEPKLNEGVGGAGLGLFMILQKVAVLSYEVEKGHITRAVALLRGDQSLRELQKKPRTVLLFEAEPAPTSIPPTLAAAQAVSLPRKPKKKERQ